MRLILMTQNDPFFLPDSISDFLDRLESKPEHDLVQAIISYGSSNDRKEGYLKRLLKVLNVFGARFFLFYAAKYFVNTILLRKTVTRVLEARGIPVWKLYSGINNHTNENRLRELNPDLLIIISGNQILKKNIIDIPKYGVINAHSSLLPAYKGILPTFWVLKNNEKQTGVTVYKVTEAIDNGPIITSRKFDIAPGLSHADLVKKSKLIANELIIAALDMISRPELFRQISGPGYFKFPSRADVNEFLRNRKRFF